MRRLLSIGGLAVVLATLSAPARAAGSDSAMRAAIDGFASALNAHGPAAQSCAPDATIIDEFSPYVWSGPGACAKWLADLDHILARIRMTNLRFVPGKTLYATAGGYIVVSTRITWMLQGRPGGETAVWTFALKRISGTWKIAAMSVGRAGDI